jgi:hypothetical protein
MDCVRSPPWRANILAAGATSLRWSMASLIWPCYYRGETCLTPRKGLRSTSPLIANEVRWSLSPRPPPWVTNPINSPCPYPQRPNWPSTGLHLLVTELTAHYPSLFIHHLSSYPSNSCFGIPLASGCLLCQPIELNCKQNPGTPRRHHRTPPRTPPLSTHSSIPVRSKLVRVHDLWWTSKAHPSFNFGATVFSCPERAHWSLCAVVTVNKHRLGLNPSNWVRAFARVGLRTVFRCLYSLVQVAIAVESRLHPGARRGSIMDRTLWRNRSGRGFTQILERHMNSATTSFWVFQIARGLCAKWPTQARLPGRGPDRASFSPELFIVFLFPFSAKLGDS